MGKAILAPDYHLARHHHEKELTRGGKGKTSASSHGKKPWPKTKHRQVWQVGPLFLVSREAVRKGGRDTHSLRKKKPINCGPYPKTTETPAAFHRGGSQR